MNQVSDIPGGSSQIFDSARVPADAGATSVRLSGPGPRRAPTVQRVSLACALGAVLLGLAVLAGWAFGFRPLKSIAPGTVSMKPNTALAMALTGAALLSVHLAPRKLASRVAATVIAVFVGAIGLLTLLEYVLHTNLGIDLLLFHERAGAVGTAAPGRMAATSAVALVLLAATLGLVSYKRALPHQLAAAALLVLAFSAVVDYLYGVEVAKPPGTGQVATYTVAGMILAGAGLLLARPDEGMVAALFSDEPGALVARWLLVSGAVIWVIFGGLRLAGQEAGLYSARIGVSIMVTGSLVGLALVVAVTATRLNALGRQRSLVLGRLTESERRLRRTLDRLLHVQETERRELAMDLHDDALPALAGVTLLIELAAEQCAGDDVSERLHRAQAELRAVTSRLRYLTFDLLPATLAREGLGPALRHRLEQLHARTGIDCELHDRVARAPSPEAAAVLYRIAVEALRNVARHAQASLVRVELERRNGRIEVTISDDGVGIDDSAVKRGHMGLSMMEERADLAGGEFIIRAGADGGTTVRFSVPAQVDPDVAAATAALLEQPAAHRPRDRSGAI